MAGHRMAVLLVVRARRGIRRFTLYCSAARSPGFRVDAIDATGAGDGFVSGRRVDCWDSRAADTPILERPRSGNAAGALTATQRGAIPALPTRGSGTVNRRSNSVADPAARQVFSSALHRL
jgi:sugar/nucleoside kinase (ribokinase family)